MVNDIAWQLKTNEALWKRWREFGVVSGDEFEVEFHFYATKEDSANALITGMEKAGFEPRKEVRRTLVKKDWHIVIPISRSWTLDALNDQTRQFCKLASMLRLVFDGFGAYMPTQDAEEKR